MIALCAGGAAVVVYGLVAAGYLWGQRSKGAACHVAWNGGYCAALGYLTRKHDHPERVSIEPTNPYAQEAADTT